MKRNLFAAACTWMALAATVGAIPSSITYQGALKQTGLPASGNKTMLFRITNQDGTQVYWSSGNMTVSVTNGLFSVHINPTGVDWQNVAPYIEVSVEGQILLPREPVGAAPYALMCESVANEKGMIAMFANDCPVGWNRFTALDNAFPMGGATYGATGGSASHTHSLVVAKGGQGVNANSGGFVGTVSGNNSLLMYQYGDSGVIDTRGADTTPASSLPPYLTMVYCQKQ